MIQGVVPQSGAVQIRIGESFMGTGTWEPGHGNRDSHERRADNRSGETGVTLAPGD